jgi:P27 family predicted phage terminase small subunit
MPTPRKSPQLRAIEGDRKAGESQRRSSKSTARRPVTHVDPPRPLPSSAQSVWDRLMPLLVERGMLTEENADVLWTYAIATAQNSAAADMLFDESGAPMPMVAGDRGKVKNPAAQVFRDTAATMRQLAGALHLDELGVGKEPDGKQGAARLLS